MNTPERTKEFVDDVRRLIALSQEFDRSLCYSTRREYRRLRFELSVKAGSFAADLAAELHQVEQLVVAEGGAS